MTQMPADLPAGYRQVHHFTLTERRTLVWMNVIGLVLFVLALGAVLAGLKLYGQIGSPLVVDSLPSSLSAWSYFLMAIVTLLLHEGLHGVVIRTCGYTPHFGVKLTRMVFYTTADATFTRAQYLTVTLAPVLAIGLLGIMAMLLAPVGLALWVGIMVALNTASSIGDLWMAAVMTSYPSQTMFRDEADGMRVFLPES